MVKLSSENIWLPPVSSGCACVVCVGERLSEILALLFKFLYFAFDWNLASKVKDVLFTKTYFHIPLSQSLKHWSGSSFSWKWICHGHYEQF